MFSAILMAALTAGCNNKPAIVTVEINVQLMSDGVPFEQAEVPVSLTDAGGAVTYDAVTNAAGIASFKVAPGAYTASVTFKTVAEGKRTSFNGSNANITVTQQTAGAFPLELRKVESQQLIVKELYCGGCQKDDGSGSYINDSYIIIYNNSEFEADASDLIFGNLMPYNAESNSNKYYTSNGLLYESEDWLPAGGAVWYFPSGIKIPAYSQITIAVFAAIDHTATVKASVNLSDPSYYWMANTSIPAFTHAKHAVSDQIPVSHYLYGLQINQGSAWTLSTRSPALYIAKMEQSALKALNADTAAYDFTSGSNAIGWAMKLPKSSVIGAVEVYLASSIETSHPRFPAAINTGYLVMTNNHGYSIYRNVDKDATEALPENNGKLVYNYSLGTEDVGGTTDPSGIDAEASMAAGAHIVFAQTNNSGKDFHQRRIASLKK